MVSKSSHEAGWIDCNKYSAEYAERLQSALDYRNKIKNLKKVRREDGGLEFAREEKTKCIGDLEKIIGDKLGSICIDCGLGSYLELTTQKGYEKANDRGISMRRWATLLAVHGADPLECDHWFSNNPTDGEGLLLHIMRAMHYLNDLEVYMHQEWEISKMQENNNLCISSNDAIGRADRISRTNPTAVRFQIISFFITRYLIKCSGYFDDLVCKIGEKIDDAIFDLFNRGRKNIYFYTQEDSAWPILDRLACSFDEINEKHGRNVDLKTFLNHDDAYFNLAKKNFLKKSENVIAVTDPHEFIYGTYKAVLDSIPTPKGKEGEPFEKLVQWVTCTLGNCEVFQGANYISGEEVDLVAKSNDILIIGECKYKGRYYDPDAGVKHVEDDIIGAGNNQINKRRKTFLNNGTIKTAKGVEIPGLKRDVNHVIPIVIHNQEYIFPEYRDSEIRDDNYGVHSFSIEGFMIAVFTCNDIGNFLTYLQFRREYIKAHREKFFNAKIFDELDICTSFVNGGQGTYDLNGKYKLVSCEVGPDFFVNVRKHWRVFLDAIYHGDKYTEIHGTYQETLVSSVKNDIEDIKRGLEKEKIKDESNLNEYERKLYNYYNLEKGKFINKEDAKKELAKSYVYFEI